MASNLDESSTPTNNESETAVSDNSDNNNNSIDNISEETSSVEIVETQITEAAEEIKTESDEPISSETNVEETTTIETREATIDEPEKLQDDSTPQERVIQAQENTETVSSKPRSVKFSSTTDDIESTIPVDHSSSVKSRYSSSSYKPSRRPVDFIDALVESYKLETAIHQDPLNNEEKKYVPKTSRSRLNPNWREHRTRRLMNKLEELSLWDREEEMKASQAQSLREQKWEQIQDRQRNHDLCLSLMRQRHESEMESAVILDRASIAVNDENKTAVIERTLKLAAPMNGLGYDYSFGSPASKRRTKKDKDLSDDEVTPKTPIGRYRQFETKMSDKIDRINQKIQPDHEIMSAYNANRMSIPTSAVPLFSETYAALLAVPDPSPSNKYNQYHYSVASYLHQPHHASSPDFESRRRLYSGRDVRVPLKEQANEYNYYDDEPTQISYTRAPPMEDEYVTKHRSNLIDYDYYPTKNRSIHLDEEQSSKYRSKTSDDDYFPSKNRSIYDDDEPSTKFRSSGFDDETLGKYRSSSSSSRIGYSPPRRTTNLASPTASSLYDCSTVTNTPRDFSFLHSRPPASNSIHQRSLNDDLNAITKYSNDASKKILQSVTDTPNGLSGKSRSTASSSTGKHVSFHDHDGNVDDYNFRTNFQSRHQSTKSTYEPVDIISLSSTR